MFQIRSLLTRFRADTSGNVAILGASATFVCLLAVGAAVDQSRVVSTRTRLQAGLDSAVLAAVLAPAANRDAIAAKTLQATLVGTNVAGASATWTTNADGSYTGVVSGQVPTAFMKIAGIGSMGLSATSKAGLASLTLPTTATLTVTQATGWFWKQVTLWVHRPGDATDTLLATYTYQPTDFSGIGTGPTTGPLGVPISLGATYDALYLQMDVSPDGCGPGMAQGGPTYDPTSGAMIPCTPANATTPKTATIYTFKTNDPATINHLFVGGVQMSPATVSSVLAVLACNQSVAHAWEDTRDYDPSAPGNTAAWSSQDIIFNVTAGTCVKNASFSSGARLLR